MSEARVGVCAWGLGPDGLPDEVEVALTIARALSSAIGGELRLAVLGELRGGARRAAARYAVAGIDRIHDSAGKKLDEVQADLYVDAFAKYLQRSPARAVLVAQTFDARLVAPRLAGRIDAGIVMNCTGLEADGDVLEATVSAYGGDTRAVYRCAGKGTYLFSINPNAVLPAPLEGEQPAPAVVDVAVDLGATEERVRVVERPDATEGPRLEHAQVIVAGGRGLGTPENFRFIEELAAALGGMAAASRPIVDDGWANPSQQVGLTGKITKPALYVAAGISGASQHMVGCAAAKTLVAINRDRDAAIFRYARYGIVGDCLEILPEIARAVKARNG